MDPSFESYARKRFLPILDEPETWELDIMRKHEREAIDAAKKQPESVSNQLCSSEDQEDCEAAPPRSKRQRRNAIRPNSMTQRVARNVADGFQQQEAARLSGKFAVF